MMALATNRDYYDDEPTFETTFGVYVQQHIGTVKLGEYGMSPVRAMLDVIGRHAENVMPGESAEYHATILGQAFTVVVALDGDS